MVADDNVQLLLGVMECTAEVDAGESLHQILPFHAAPVLSALPRGLHWSSVSVLMLIVPPIKIYIKSYNATRSHASNESSLVMG